MAELLMECEEEELAPWQQMDKDSNTNNDDDDDDEPIFVSEISGSKTSGTTPNSSGQSNSFGRTENGTPVRGSNTTFQTANNLYKPQTTRNVTPPFSPIYQPLTRPPVSSAVVQPLPRLGMPEPVRRPAPGGLTLQQPPRPSLVTQPVSRPAAFPANSPPVCRNITFPTVSQSPLRPVATIPAQPVMANQGYIMTSPQISSNTSQNAMYGLKPNATSAPYQGVQSLTPAGNTTTLMRPLQPLHQIRPVSTPARTPTFIHRAPPPTPTMPQNSLNLTVLQQPSLQNPQKTQQTILTQSPSANTGRNENAPEKRLATIDLTDDPPKKLKTNENIAESRPVGASTGSTSISGTGRQQHTTPLHTTTTKVNTGPGSGTSPAKNGTTYPLACPKCNIHFNLLETLKKHMTYCCPEKKEAFFREVANTGPSQTQIIAEDNEKGKLIMLVSDFYYGMYAGDPQLVEQEQKTNTTFKCFSCHKLLKNNIRFMNHMKHHLEHEKQSSESWENHTTCHHCYRHFPTPFQLQCHIESSHTLYESTTICKICELSFDTEQILLQHMKDNHKPGEMPYVCQLCNFRSSMFSDVDNHFRNVHENTKSLLCPYCLKVIKSGTPYMQHYMKHQNKGVYRCAKCRLQFLTCKEKMDHKTQHHKTFKKPTQLDGLPPGTKVTIRASTGGTTNPSPSPTSSISKNPLATSPKPQLLPSTPPQSVPKVNTPSPKTKLLPLKVNLLFPKLKSLSKKIPNTTKRVKTVNTALQSIRYVPGFHRCIECNRQVVDFEGHFHSYVHCSKCSFSTSCNKAYSNHMSRFHGRNSSKRSASQKHPKDKRRITAVCLNCDVLTDVAGLDEMAKHLSEMHTHSCQVVTENVSIISSTHEGDMSKSRLQLPVDQTKSSYKEENSDSEKNAITDASLEQKLTTETTESESDACEDMETSSNQKSALLPDRDLTKPEKLDADTEFTDSRSSVPEDSSSVPEDSTPAPEDSNPAPEDSNPAPEDSNPAPEDSNSAPEDWNPAPEDSNPVSEDSNPVSEDSNPVSEDFNPVSEDSNLVSENFNRVPEDSNPVPEDSNPVPEDFTPVPEDSQMEYESKTSPVLTEKGESSRDSASETSEPSDNEAAIPDDYGEPSSPLKDGNEEGENASSDNIGIEQFLSQNARGSASSDISEPSSLQLDPLTPSEVLEHQTTEILHKDNAVADSSEEKSEDLPDVSPAVADSSDEKSEDLPDVSSAVADSSEEKSEDLPDVSSAVADSGEEKSEDLPDVSSTCDDEEENIDEN